MSDGAIVDLRIQGISEAREIGHGGFANVYRAQSVDSGDVAVKVMRSVADERSRRRFESELELIARLGDDPNVVRLLSSGTTNSGQPYLVMPYLARGSLEDEIATAGPQPWREVLADLGGVADSLGRAHERGLIHRDVKPANLLRGDDGLPKLADFGIAREFGDEGALVSTSITATPAYTAPEQFSEGTSSQASDVYSLASTAYALIAGSPPHLERGEEVTLLTLMKRVTEDPIGDLRPAVPDEVQTLLEQAMHKDPGQRPTAAELAPRLRELSEADLSFDPNATIVGRRRPAETAASAAPNTSWRPILALGVAGLAVLGTLAFFFPGDDEPEVADRGTVVDYVSPPTDVVVIENGPNEEGTHTEVAVDWNWQGAADEPPPRGFLIYRTREDGINPLPTEVASETNQVQVDTKFQFGHTYCVTVVAYLTRNELSEPSEEQCVTTPEPTVAPAEKIDTGELPTAGHWRPEPIDRELVEKVWGLTAFWVHDNPETVVSYDVELRRGDEVVHENSLSAAGFNAYDFFITFEDNYCVIVTPQNATGAGEPLEQCIDFVFPQA